jgi:cell division protein FtsB
LGRRKVSAARGYDGRQKEFLRGPHKKRRYGRLLLILAFLFICYVYLGGDYGLLKIWSQRKQIEELRKEIHRLHAEQMDLQEECRRLETDSTYLEKRIREGLGMVKEGERVFQFVPQSDSTGERI